jgi:hypothetical protein
MLPRSVLKRLSLRWINLFLKRAITRSREAVTPEYSVEDVLGLPAQIAMAVAILAIGAL